VDRVEAMTYLVSELRRRVVSLSIMSRLAGATAQIRARSRLQRALIGAKRSA
jgi:hypothetical protein